MFAGILHPYPHDSKWFQIRPIQFSWKSSRIVNVPVKWRWSWDVFGLWKTVEGPVWILFWHCKLESWKFQGHIMIYRPDKKNNLPKTNALNFKMFRWEVIFKLHFQTRWPELCCEVVQMCAFQKAQKMDGVVTVKTKANLYHGHIVQCCMSPGRTQIYLYHSNVIAAYAKPLRK